MNLSYWESGFLLFIQEHIRCSALNGIMRVLSTLGNVGMVWIAVAVLYLIFKKTRREKVLVAAALIFSLIITNLILKNLVHRIRPYDLVETLSILVPKEKDLSFPSGHASSSFAAAWALWRGGNKKIGIAALILAALITVSRLYVGVHYPTDVLAGTAVGILCGELAYRLTGRIPEKADSLQKISE